MEVSNPDKVMYPADGYTKAEVVGYYQAVAAVMLPHLEGRPLTLQRYPNGIHGNGFMQKNASSHFPASIERVEVPKEGGTTNHPLISSADDLAYLANQGTITFHIWTSRLPDLERPDRLVLDLDPPDGGGPPREPARVARSVLDEVGLDSGLMTTGSSGFHVVAAIRPEHDFETVGHLARLLAGVVAAQMPDSATTEFLKKNRKGRVFIDWLRNRWAQSAVSPWALRPLDGAPVAMPIDWEELDAADPRGWDLESAPTRAEQPDPWPEPGKLDPEAIEALADEHDVAYDEPFDRFGR
ncbi:MAG TPA: non-homologous end-joining DNA ligase [Acidimicrobiia bacterium]|nr:non-homologous end-joining DNA ligase [Acidimicrobiia bacterium]